MSSSEIQNSLFSDVIQPGDLVIVLMIVLGIFVVVQILNGVTNILTARHMKKVQLAQIEAREVESAAQIEQMESVIRKFSEIIEMEINAEAKLDYILEQLHDMEGSARPGIKRRGPYGPRKKKAIEHKKTPPEN